MPPVRLALAAALLAGPPLLAACSVLSPDEPVVEAPTLPLLLVEAVAASPAPAVGQTATLAADFRFVTPADPHYAQFTDRFLRRLDSLFAAQGEVAVEAEVRFYPPGRFDQASDVVRVGGPATTPQRVRRDGRVRVSVPITGLREGRAVGLVLVRAVADDGTALGAPLGVGFTNACFTVGERVGTYHGNCVSSSGPGGGTG